MKKTILFFKRFSLPIVIVFLFTSFSMAAAPLFINYQGKLTNSSGEPIDGAVTVTFKFYNHLTLSNPINILGSPSSIPVNSVNGVFSVPIPVEASWFSGTEVYLGVSVNGGDEMAPRQKLVASPYALAVGANSVGSGELKIDAVTSEKIQAGSVSGGVGGKIAAGTVDNVDLKDNAVSSAKIQAGAVSGGVGGKIAAGTVDNVDLKDNAVSSAKIQAGAVSGGVGGKISAGTIESVDLKDDAVSSAKIQAGAVSGGVGGKISAGTIESVDLKDDAVTKGKLSSGDLLDVYKTRGDERLILGANYYSAVCDVSGTTNYYECNGTCGSDTEPNYCTTGVLIGRVVKP